MLYAKTATYGVLHIVVSFLVGWLVSGDVHIGLGIALVEPLAQIFGFYLHEKFWVKAQNKRQQKDPEASPIKMVTLPCCLATAEMLKKAEGLRPDNKKAA